jgi:hypothetical protein
MNAIDELTVTALEKMGISPPDQQKCSEYLPMTARDYCQRSLFEGCDRCFWHAESKTKYEAASLQMYFGEGTTLRSAVEAEVRAGRSLENAYLEEAMLRGSFIQQGANLRGALFVRANLKNAFLSYTDLVGAKFCRGESGRSSSRKC